MVSEDSSMAGSGSKTACIKKQQKNLMNSLSSSDHGLRDSQGGVHSPPLTKVTAPDSVSQPQEQGSGHSSHLDDWASEPELDALFLPTLQSRNFTLKESLLGFSDQLDAGSPHFGSEAEDSLLDGAETSLEKSSSMGVVDSSNMASSEDVRTLACVLRSEVILIDEDDDDMSLRERTVTDCSVTDGNAAQLVCGHLLSVSSNSSPSACHSERRSQSLVATPVPEQEEEQPKRPKRLCCSIL